MKIFLIINKLAGRNNKHKNVLDKIQNKLKSGNNELEFVYSEFRGHGVKLEADAAKKNYDIVVAVGGDGTVNEVARGLLGTSVTMGIIPTGSGNGLARDLGISTNIEKSIKTLIDGKTSQIDVCLFNKQHFLCTSGIGFDAKIAYEMAKSEKRGFVQYIKLTVNESLFFKPFEIKINIDGKIIEQKVFLLTFANARQFGNNAFIAPNASTADALIDVVLVHPFPKILLPVFTLALFTKTIHHLPFVKTFKAKKIDLQFADTSFFHFDGEPENLNLPARISIVNQKLQIITA